MVGTNAETPDICERTLDARLKGAANGARGNGLDAYAVLFCDARKELKVQAAHITRLISDLKAFVGSAYPVAIEINERGYNWCEAYLDSARTEAVATLEALRNGNPDGIQ